MFVPWFNECHELIEQFVQQELPQFDATYRACQNQDPHDVMREIFDLERQGCALDLPTGLVDSVALEMLDRELCSQNAAAHVPVGCTASSEYNDAYACENVFDGSSEDGYYSQSNEGGRGRAGTSWATRGTTEGNGPGSGPGFHASITLDFGSPKTFGSMIFAQRNNLPGECFGRVVLTFDGQADPTVPLSLQCTPDMTTYSFPPVTASTVTITGAGTAEGADVVNPGAREIQFLSHAGARETTLPIELPQRGFDIGASIVCNGVLNQDDSRFSLNLGVGIGDTGMSGDIALHVNPRFASDGAADVLVLNTRQGGSWGPEDRETVPPFRAMQSFQVSVLATHAGYQVSFPGHPEFVGGPEYHGVVPSTHLYEYRVDPATVDTINQEDNTLTTCTYLPPPGVCDESVETPVCAHGSDSFEGGDLQGWHTVGSIGSNDIFPAALIHVPTVAFHGCNTCFGPDHDGDCSHCADGFYFITTDEGTTFDGEDDAPTGVLQSGSFMIGQGAIISFMIGGGNHDYPGGAGTRAREGFVDVPDVCALTLEIQQSDGSWNIGLSATGHNADDLSTESWDASAFAGSVARYRIYDTHSGGWGHIAVDNIVCSNCSPAGECDGWTQTAPGCVNGHNMDVYQDLRDPNRPNSRVLIGQSVAQCKQLCLDTPGCAAVEYGVSYGGDGSYQAGDCQLQDSANAGNCDGSHYNLDLYSIVPPTPSPGGGHRRAETVDTPTYEMNSLADGKRMLQLAGLGRFDTESCSFNDLAARASEVDMKCCSTARVDGQACQGYLPATCSYTCAAQFVPFFDDCNSLLSALMADQMPEYEQLAEKCLPKPDAVPTLMTTISTAQCVGASTTWRIVVPGVQGGGHQVQLTEVAFVLGEEQLGAGIVAPVIAPGGTNGQDPLFMNNADPASGDQTNCDPLPCSFTYTFDAVVTPDAVRIAYADSEPRYPTSIDVEYLNENADSWTHFSTTMPVPDPGHVQYADIPIASASVVNPACVSAPRSSFTTIHLEEFQRGLGEQSRWSPPVQALWQ